MSWNVNAIGTPELLCKHLDGVEDGLTGESKAEFIAAKPLLVGLLRMNKATTPPILELSASGHAYGGGGLYSSCLVSLKGCGFAICKSP